MKGFTIVLLSPIHENNRIFFVDPCSTNEHVLLELLQEQEMHVKGNTNTSVDIRGCTYGVLEDLGQGGLS